MTAKSTTSLHRKKKHLSNNQYVIQCMNWFKTALEENAAQLPKIFIDGERYQPDFPVAPNQTQVHFTFTNEGSPRAIKYKLNSLEDEGLLTLQQLLPTFPYLTELRFEFCNLSYDQVVFIHMILQENHQIVRLSLNGNPNRNEFGKKSHHLLHRSTNLKVYSVQLCKLGPSVCQLFYNELHIPDKYTRNLVSLNLGCNHLGDVGCAWIAQILRTNRALQALNISENGISETGLLGLLEVFSCFKLHLHETFQKRKLRFKQLMQTHFPSSKTEAFKSSSVSPDKFGFISHDPVNAANQFNHPFITDSLVKDGQLFCSGNNSLTYLNIAYNGITRNVLEDLIEKINYQKTHLKFGGLQRVVFESQQTFPDLEEEIIKRLSSPNQRTTARISRAKSSLL